MLIECKLDQNTVLVGEGRWIDQSYDDEFGTAKRIGFQLEHFEVMTRIGGDSYDVTTSLPTHVVKAWQRLLLEHNDIEPVSY